jgi:hypothetical protein
MELLWIFLCPTAKILTVVTARQLELCFICHNDNIVKKNSDQMLSYRATVCHVTIT